MCSRFHQKLSSNIWEGYETIFVFTFLGRFWGQITPELIKLFLIFTKMDHLDHLLISFHLNDVDEEKYDSI